MLLIKVNILSCCRLILEVLFNEYTCISQTYDESQQYDCIVVSKIHSNEAILIFL